MTIVPLTDPFRPWANQLIVEHWASTDIYSRWRWIDTRELPGFVAMLNDEPVGLATYRIDEEGCELVTLNSLQKGRGAGEALLFAVREVARAAGCPKLWLTTSNDNLNALRFYQKRGMQIVAVHRFAVDKAREVKIAIPVIGAHGIPCRDELELEMVL